MAVHYKDFSMFASASMGQKTKNVVIFKIEFSSNLRGHTKGVVAVAICPLNDKACLASGSDDK